MQINIYIVINSKFDNFVSRVLGIFALYITEQFSMVLLINYIYFYVCNFKAVFSVVTYSFKSTHYY